jgi:hypothetical protein
MGAAVSDTRRRGGRGGVRDAAGAVSEAAERRTWCQASGV